MYNRLVALQLQGPGLSGELFVELYRQAVQMLRADQTTRRIGVAGQYEGGLTNTRRYNTLGTFGGFRIEAVVDREVGGTTRLVFLAEDLGAEFDYATLMFMSPRQPPQPFPGIQTQSQDAN